MPPRHWAVLTSSDCQGSDAATTQSEHVRFQSSGFGLADQASPSVEPWLSQRDPLYVYPFSTPARSRPHDWVQFGGYQRTKCSNLAEHVLQRDAVSVRLFNPDSSLFENLLFSANHINHSYNCRGAYPEKDWSGYEGGHSGWDLQTQNATEEELNHVMFYSLTKGVVAALNWKQGLIAVHTDDGHTVYYQHARQIYVTTGMDIKVGTPLGVQGNAGLGLDELHTRSHLHISVRIGRHAMPTPIGAVETIDPVRYLHRYLYE